MTAACVAVVADWGLRLVLAMLIGWELGALIWALAT